MGKKKWIILAVGIVVAVLAAVYLALGFYFRSHFWFRTMINGVDCSGKSVAEVEEVIRREIGRYAIKLQERDGGTETIKGSDIGLTPVFDGSLDKELRSRSGFAWPVSLIQTTTLEFETMVDYREELFLEAVEALECLKPENNRKPENAYISEYKTGVGYEIVPEKEGTLLDSELLKEELRKAIIGLKGSLSLEEGFYAEPEIRSDNPELTALLKNMNTCVSASIIYEFGGATEVLDGEDIHTWLSVTDENEIVIDEEQAAGYVKELAEKYDTASKARSFTTSYGPTVTLYTNAYGWRIDQGAETEKLLADIREGNKISREPAYKQTARSRGSQDHGGTYVEINLTAQHLYFYKNGGLVVESDFVSGNLAKGWDTPSGAFGLTYKQRDAVLRGEDYRTPVDFWMPFNGGIGLHDATWRSDFGGSYYKTSGSHGCINLPYGVAKTIFENIESGDAVFVYELSGTESGKGQAQDAAAEVMDAINAIGDVTLDSAGAVEAARAAYDGLNDAAKGYVKNYDTLVNAEAAYAGLVAQQQAEQAAAQAQSQAQPVIDAISAIGEVTLDKQAAVEAARSQYNALPDGAKPYVINLNVLEAAEARLLELLSGAGA